MKTILFTFSIFISLFAESQVKDVDGNEYNSLQIGENEFLATNLRVTKFRNGDPIKFVSNEKEWKRASKKKKPVCAYYNYDSSTFITHGLMYNWPAVDDSRGLALEGWKVPSISDWENLVSNLGGEKEAYIKMTENSAHLFPIGGVINWVTGALDQVNEIGYYWSSEGFDSSCTFVGHTIELNAKKEIVEFDTYGKWNGIMVRCIKE